jgi:hypothetical protein
MGQRVRRTTLPSISLLPNPADAVIIGEKPDHKLPFLRYTMQNPPLLMRRTHMKPRDLADTMSSTLASTTFTLPIVEARAKAHEIINCASRDGIITIVENWHLVSDDQVEFTVRDLRSSNRS